MSKKLLHASFPSSSSLHKSDKISMMIWRISTKAFFGIPRRRWFFPISLRSFTISSEPPSLPRQSTATLKIPLQKFSLNFYKKKNLFYSHDFIGVTSKTRRALQHDDWSIFKSSKSLLIVWKTFEVRVQNFFTRINWLESWKI